MPGRRVGKFSLDEAPAAFEQQLRSDEAIKVLVKM